jgi:outer membrane PBP1 activator LpoA protein
LLATKATQARALLPQLALAGVNAGIRVATSQIVSGTGKPAEDAALDGIVYPTEAWGVRNVDGLPSQASAAALVDTAKGPAARLFAFGYDAWLLTGYLERLALSKNGDVAGATGRLSLDGFGNVLRVPVWSRFSGGVPVPLADGAR